MLGCKIRLRHSRERTPKIYSPLGSPPPRSGLFFDFTKKGKCDEIIQMHLLKLSQTRTEGEYQNISIKRHVGNQPCFAASTSTASGSQYTGAKGALSKGALEADLSIMHHRRKKRMKRHESSPKTSSIAQLTAPSTLTDSMRRIVYHNTS